jgi:hypothetical protein
MELLTLVSIFFLTSIISVVTGSTSLIKVPVMLQFGIEPRSAIATNMLALTLMSVGGSLSFLGRNVIERRRNHRLHGDLCPVRLWGVFQRWLCYDAHRRLRCPLRYDLSAGGF